MSPFVYASPAHTSTDDTRRVGPTLNDASASSGENSPYTDHFTGLAAPHKCSASTDRARYTEWDEACIAAGDLWRLDSPKMDGWPASSGLPRRCGSRHRRFSTIFGSAPTRANSASISEYERSENVAFAMLLAEFTSSLA